VVQVFLGEFGLVLFGPAVVGTASTASTGAAGRGIEPVLFYVALDVTEIAWVVRYLFNAMGWRIAFYVQAG